jgi:hypothetical protein
VWEFGAEFDAALLWGWMSGGVWSLSLGWEWDKRWLGRDWMEFGGGENGDGMGMGMGMCI